MDFDDDPNGQMDLDDDEKYQMDLDDDENYQMDFYYSIFDRLHTPKVY